MDHFNTDYFGDSTDMPPYNDGNNPDVDPSLLGLGEIPNYDDFDFQAFLNAPPDDGIPLPSAYPEEGLMDMDLQQRISYHEEYNGDSSGTVNPAAIFSPSVASQGQPPRHENQFVESRPTLSVIPVDPTLLGQDPMQDGQYRNAILNSFSSPITPLQVIDRINFPFDRQLQVALQKAKEHEKEQELATTLRDGIATPAPAQSPASRKIARIKKEPGNKRTENIRAFNPAEFYSPLESRPASWGSINPETGDQMFQYTEYGELNPLHAFTVGQMIEYISEHPLHSTRRSNSGRSGLKLWVQTVPADSGRRYPDKSSDKCRFAACPDPNRTIRKGEFRVAFDEESTRRKTDPFHTAGYVHLYCLEKFLDFPQICKDFNVLPDTRALKEGKNRMAINRDHESMSAIVQEFIAYSKPWSQFGREGKRPEEYYEYTLSSALTDEHLARQPKHLSKIRELRGGNHLDIHRNNLDLRVKNARTIRVNKASGLTATAPRPATAPKTRQKRKCETKEEQSVLDDNILELSPCTKRAKRSSTIPSPISTRRPSRPTKARRTGTPERRRTRSSTSMDSQKSKVQTPTSSPKKLTQEDADFVPSSRKRKSEDSNSSEPKRRRSLRSPEFLYPEPKF